MKGALIIIPNKHILNLNPFYKELEVGETHVILMNDFANNNKIKLRGLFIEHSIPMAGHAIVRIGKEQDCIIIYLPKIITKKQNLWFQENYSLFFKNSYISYVVLDPSGKIIESCSMQDENALKSMYSYISNHTDDYDNVKEKTR